MTKTGKYEEPAPNPQSVFVLNFGIWDLNIGIYLSFEICYLGFISNFHVSGKWVK